MMAKMNKLRSQRW